MYKIDFQLVLVFIRSGSMGAISGKEYLDRINALNNEIWIDGKKVEGPVSDHPKVVGF